jgi:thiamine biosynthesis lipoprotein ApbE
MQHFPWRLALLATGIGLFLAQCAPGDASSSDSPDARGYQAALQADGRYLVQLVGETMGTTYRVRYFQPGGQTPVNYKPAVDSVLQAFNACLNTYDPQSTLSLWNADSSGLQVPFKDACGRWAKRLHRISMELYEASNGAFDPTVMPLVRYWGFFTEDPFGGSASVDSSTIDSLLDFVGYAQKLQAFDSSTVSQ